MILASLDGAMEVQASPVPVLHASVQVVAEDGLVITVAVDGTPGRAALPGRSPGTVPVVGLAVYLDGSLVPASRFLEAWDIGLASAPLQKWTLQARLPGPFGSALAFLGAAPGARRIDIAGLYLTGTGLHEVPLVSNGIVDNEQRSQQADGSTVVTITGTDAWGRQDHRLVTLNLPPGHNLNRGDVITRGALDAGFAGVGLQPGSQMKKAVQVVSQEFGAAFQPIADVEGWTLCIDRNGTLVNPVTGYDPSRRVDLVLKDRDILFGQMSFQVPGDVYTRMVLSGTEQVAADDSIRVVVSPPAISFSLFAPKTAAFAQEPSDGSLHATGIPEPVARVQMTSLVETTTTYRGQTMLAQKVVTWAWYNPQVARYSLHEDGTVDYVGDGFYGPVYLYAGAVAGDNSLAYHLPQEQFLVVGRQETVYHYDNDGYLTSTVTSKDFPFLRGAAVKRRESSTGTWESIPYVAGRLVLGNRAGVENEGATPGLEIMPSPDSAGAVVPREVTTVTDLHNDAGFLARRTTTTGSYLAAEGGLYLYSDGKAYASDVQALAESTRDELTYSASQGADSSHSETTLSFVQGRLVSQQNQNGANGYLPAATRDLSITPPADSFPDGVAAPRGQSAPIEAEYISWSLEGVRTRAETIGSDTWAENVHELQALAMRRILRDAAATCTFAMPVNFLLDPTTRLTLDLVTVDLLGDGNPQPFDVQNLVLRHSLASGGLPITTIAGKVHLATS